MVDSWIIFRRRTVTREDILWEKLLPTIGEPPKLILDEPIVEFMYDDIEKGQWTLLCHDNLRTYTSENLARSCLERFLDRNLHIGIENFGNYSVDIHPKDRYG